MEEIHDGPLSAAFRKAFPKLRDDELLEAKKNFDAFLEVCLRLYERIKEDPVAYAKLKADAEKRRAEENQDEGA